MAKLALHQGAYEARSPIANAQVSINVYGEQNPPDAPFPVTIYPAPGLKLLQDLTPFYAGAMRGLYECSNGDVVGVAGNSFFAWNPGGTPPTPITLGTFATSSFGPVSICDNGTDVVVVDNTGGGGLYAPLNNLVAGSALALNSDPAWYGSTRVDFIDTFLIFNQPGTNNFYTTTSNALLPLDPLYFAAKEGWNDKLVCCACLHDNIWVLGNTTTEIWFNAGGAAFPFARMPNSILQQGCVAPYSVVVADNAIYYLSQDRYGRNMMMRGEGYSARRVSTFAVEDEWSKYGNLYDAVGMAYQLGGHETIGMYFPTGDAWWAYDASTQLWHKRTYGPDLTNPWLPSCMCGWGAIADVGFPNAIIAGDRSSAKIYQVTRSAYTDDGMPIQRQRSWMHQQQDGQRIAYTRFALSMTGAAMSPDWVGLDWSDDAGQSYGAQVVQTTLNQTNGQYLWRRLGYGRDRVYRVTFAGQGEFAINGAYSDGIPEAT